jgi:hypothetical protein
LCPYTLSTHRYWTVVLEIMASRAIGDVPPG